VVLLLYDRVFSPLPVAALVLKLCWLALLVTFVVVEAACFMDCIPIQLYWQVVPYAGE
jgi:hypothetical protein